MRTQRIRTGRGGKKQSCGARYSDLVEEKQSRSSVYGGGFGGYRRVHKKWMYVCACVSGEPEKGRQSIEDQRTKYMRPLAIE